MIYKTGCSKSCPQPFNWGLHYFINYGAVIHPGLDPITGYNLAGWFAAFPVDFHVAAANPSCGGRPGFVDSYCPQPLINADSTLAKVVLRHPNPNYWSLWLAIC